MKRQSWGLISLMIPVVVIFSACGPSRDNQAVSVTARPTSTAAPTETATRVPTEPPATPTPENLISIDRYFPQNMNEVRWYVVSSLESGEPLGISRETNLGPENLEDGSLVNVIEYTTDLGKSASYDYIETTPDQILLRRYVDNGITENDDRSFDPPLVMLQSPLEVGLGWTVGPQVYLEGVGKKDYQLVSDGKVTVFEETYQDCYLVERTSTYEDQGNIFTMTDFRSTYCLDVGPVVIENLTEEGWIRSELLMRTSARIVLESVTDYQSECMLQLYGLGFEDGEKMSVVVQSPQGDSSTILDGFPASIHVNYPLSVQGPFGHWFFEFSGDSNTAVFIINWDGVCQEQ